VLYYRVFSSFDFPTKPDNILYRNMGFFFWTLSGTVHFELTFYFSILSSTGCSITFDLS